MPPQLQFPNLLTHQLQQDMARAIREAGITRLIGQVTRPPFG